MTRAGRKTDAATTLLMVLLILTAAKLLLEEEDIGMETPQKVTIEVRVVE